MLHHILILNVEPLHMLIQILRMILPLHHLLAHGDLIRLKGHLRHTVSAWHESILVVLVRIYLSSLRVLIHILLHTLICVHLLVLWLILYLLLLIFLRIEIAISFNGCLPRLSLVWSLTRWIEITCQIVYLPWNCYVILSLILRINLHLIILILVDLLLMVIHLFLLLDILFFLFVKSIRVTLKGF